MARQSVKPRRKPKPTLYPLPPNPICQLSSRYWQRLDGALRSEQGVYLLSQPCFLKDHRDTFLLLHAIRKGVLAFTSAGGMGAKLRIPKMTPKKFVSSLSIFLYMLFHQLWTQFHSLEGRRI
jgi:hypothetical protein